MVKREYTTISVPAELADRIKKRIKGTGFRSLSEYVIYILREIVTSAELHDRKTKAFTKEDEEEVRERLRALGYI